MLASHIVEHKDKDKKTLDCLADECIANGGDIHLKTASDAVEFPSKRSVECGGKTDRQLQFAQTL